jgi:hypothetical protein
MYKAYFLFSSLFFCGLGAQYIEKKAVRMHEQLQINYQSSEVGIKSISTTGLRGCIALGLISEYKSGYFSVIMSHYQPFSRDSQLKKLDEGIKESFSNVNPPVKQKLIILVPNETGEHKINVPNEFELSHISNIEKIVGIESTVIPYKVIETTGMKKNSIADFEIELDKGVATWKSFADNYTKHTF